VYYFIHALTVLWVTFFAKSFAKIIFDLLCTTFFFADILDVLATFGCLVSSA
jgi:hypothetical protein